MKSYHEQKVMMIRVLGTNVSSLRLSMNLIHLFNLLAYEGLVLL